MGHIFCYDKDCDFSLQSLHHHRCNNPCLMGVPSRDTFFAMIRIVIFPYNLFVTRHVFCQDDRSCGVQVGWFLTFFFFYRSTITQFFFFFFFCWISTAHSYNLHGFSLFFSFLSDTLLIIINYYLYYYLEGFLCLDSLFCSSKMPLQSYFKVETKLKDNSIKMQL